MNRSRSKKLSPQEKLILAVFATLAFILAFYFLVYQNFNKQEDRLHAEIGTIKQEIDNEDLRIRQIQVRREAIKEGRELGSFVEKYNNSTMEQAILSGFLKKYTTSYSLAFKEPPKDDTYARRAVSVNFVAPDLESARAAIDSIADCEYRNIITKLILNAKPEDDGINGTGPVSGSFTVTFIESMPIKKSGS